ncbi:MAG: hypothetical protein Fur0032_15150 [Terrimicrobiaceae bacterium]
MANTETILARKADLIETLCLLPPGEERLLHLISLGRKYPAMEESLKTPERLLPGCVSQLWIVAQREGDGMVFAMDADAAISKGIAAAVCGLYNNQAPDAILEVEPDFFAETGLSSLISPNRSNAVSSLRGFIVAAARDALGGAA